MAFFLYEAYYGLLLLSLSYFQDEVMGKAFRGSVESPFGSVRGINPGATTDKSPVGIERYSDLPPPITKIFSRHGINPEYDTRSFHKDLKIDMKYELPRFSRRHLNMAIENRNEELISEFLNKLENKHFIPTIHSRNNQSISPHDGSLFQNVKFPYNGKSFNNKKRKMPTSIKNPLESLAVSQNNYEEKQFTLNVATKNDSTKQSKYKFEKKHAVNDKKVTREEIRKIYNKQTHLFRLLFTRDLDRHLMKKRESDDEDYFLRLYIDDEDRERQNTQNPSYLRVTQYKMRNKNTGWTSYVPSKWKTPDPFWPRINHQRRRTKMTEWNYFPLGERTPIETYNKKSQITTTSTFTEFDTDAKSKGYLLFANLHDREEVTIPENENVISEQHSESTKGETDEETNDNILINLIPIDQTEGTETCGISPNNCLRQINRTGSRDTFDINVTAANTLLEAYNRYPEADNSSIEAFNIIPQADNTSPETSENYPGNYLKQINGTGSRETFDVNLAVVSTYSEADKSSSDNTSTEILNTTQEADNTPSYNYLRQIDQTERASGTFDMNLTPNTLSEADNTPSNADNTSPEALNTNQETDNTSRESDNISSESYIFAVAEYNLQQRLKSLENQIISLQSQNMHLQKNLTSFPKASNTATKPLNNSPQSDKTSPEADNSFSKTDMSSLNSENTSPDVAYSSPVKMAADTFTITSPEAEAI